MSEGEALRSPEVSWSPAGARHMLDTWQRLLALEAPQGHPRGTTLFTVGASPQAAFLLASGLVKLACLLPNGGQVLLGLRLPGQFLEERAPLLGLPHAVTAVAVTPCQAYRIEAARLRRVLDQDLEANRALVSTLLHSLNDQAVALVELKALDATQRFERLLRDLAAVLCPTNGPAPVRLLLPLSDHELGELLGVSTGHVGRLKKQAVARGLLRRQGRRVLLNTDCWCADREFR